MQRKISATPQRMKILACHFILEVRLGEEGR
jgi:hypothetical protein